eukprot:360519-Chlamydomonas_euryale.AAC.1
MWLNFCATAVPPKHTEQTSQSMAPPLHTDWPSPAPNHTAAPLASRLSPPHTKPHFFSLHISDPYPHRAPKGRHTFRTPARPTLNHTSAPSASRPGTAPPAAWSPPPHTQPPHPDPWSAS